MRKGWLRRGRARYHADPLEFPPMSKNHPSLLCFPVVLLVLGVSGRALAQAQPASAVPKGCPAFMDANEQNITLLGYTKDHRELVAEISYCAIDAFADNPPVYGVMLVAYDASGHRRVLTTSYAAPKPGKPSPKDADAIAAARTKVMEELALTPSGGVQSKTKVLAQVKGTNVSPHFEYPKADGAEYARGTALAFELRGAQDRGAQGARCVAKVAEFHLEGGGMGYGQAVVKTVHVAPDGWVAFIVRAEQSGYDTARESTLELVFFHPEEVSLACAPAVHATQKK